MSVKMQISITKEVLEKSKYCGLKGLDGWDSGPIIRNCAVALAIRSIWPEGVVYHNAIRPFGGANNRLINLPIKAIDFISNFDKFRPEDRVQMQPISFEIEIPDEVIEKINIEELKPLLVNHPTLKLVD